MTPTVEQSDAAALTKRARWRAREAVLWPGETYSERATALDALIRLERAEAEVKALMVECCQEYHEGRLCDVLTMHDVAEAELTAAIADIMQEPKP